MPNVQITIADRVAEVVIDRPPLNVIDLGLARELTSGLVSLEGRTDLIAMVVRARGPAFSAGVDVRDHLPDRGAEMIRVFHHVFRVLLESEIPLLMVVQGAALGGGCELLLLADFVIAAEAATFGFPEIKLGVFPPIAAVALPRAIGATRASDLLLTGRTIDAREALRLGLVTRLTPADGLDAALGETLASLKGMSREALLVAKRAMRVSGARLTAEEIDAVEHIYMRDRLEAEDAIEGLNAFLEKRVPKWW
jgi:cyclohexa-1,5-dienecarbonyl-CoA hydratase